MSDGIRKDQRWRDYERVAADLLNKLAKEFGLQRVEGKQLLVGKQTGTEWEVDAKGVVEDGEGFVLIECRETKARQSQAKVAALAFQIQDTGATGGIVVSPLPLQAGAQKIARATNIRSVQIDANSTPANFAVKFLNKIFLGVTMRASATLEADLMVSRVCTKCSVRFPAKGSETTCPACVSESAS